MRTVTPQFEGAVRRDFFDPKVRPIIPAKPPIDWRTIILAGILTTGVVGSEAIFAWKPASRLAPVVKSEVTTKSEVTSEITPRSESRPVPTPAPLATPVPEPLVVRAQPVEPEPVVRRASLVEGQLFAVQMPDGTMPLIRYMGSVASFDQLPKNPHLYELYQVASSGHSWVFMQPAGFSAPAWVDP